MAAKKNLIVCLDGTWCDGDHDPGPRTNIAILANIIEPRPGGGPEPEQRVYYDAGVGTGGGFLDRMFGGAFGKGLSANVLAAYRFLSQFYAPGDNIYVFGFSRGAFTARSLCGFLSASGLLTKDMCDEENQAFAWSHYRTPPKARYPADHAKLQQITHDLRDPDPSDPRVRFLGVFDTVGALGVPNGVLGPIGRRAVEFHDTELSSVVRHSCQALAIDEQRVEFEPALWIEPVRARYAGTVEQVWFPGSHANIGGGHADTGLSDLVLGWMIRRLHHRCPELTLKPPEEWKFPFKPSHRGPIYDDSRSWLFWPSRWRPLMRLINRCKPGRARFCRLPDTPPHTSPIGEMVHLGALARWDETKVGARRRRYQPPNLMAALESMGRGETPVVGPEGEPISATAEQVSPGANPAPAPTANGAERNDGARDPGGVSAARSNGDARAKQVPPPIAAHVR